MIVKTATAHGKKIEVHEASFGNRRYWATVDGGELFQRGCMRARMFTTADRALAAAIEEAQS